MKMRGVALAVFCSLFAGLGIEGFSISSLFPHVPQRQTRGSDVLLEVPLVDGHNDLPYNIRVYAKDQLKNFDFNKNLSTDPYWSTIKSSYTDLPRLRKGRVGGQFWVAYVDCQAQYKDALKQTIEQIDLIHRLIKAYPDDLQYVTTSQGIWDAFNNGKIASMIVVEGGHSIDSQMGILRVMYSLGVRYMTLTHWCNTPWGDASPVDDPTTGIPVVHGGLSEFGKKMVLEMNRLGMMVDLSHVSHATMLDALSVSRAPVIFSHSSAYSVCNHHRNVRDDVLSLIPDNKGIVMVNFYSSFVNCDPSREATLEDVVAHINHIRQIAGVDHVGIGGDYDGVSMMPQGLEDVSKYPDLFDRLAEGRPGEPVWTQEDLKKLAGLNIIRVFGDVEKARDLLASELPSEDQVARADLGDNVGCLTDFNTVADRRTG